MYVLNIPLSSFPIIFLPLRQVSPTFAWCVFFFLLMTFHLFPTLLVNARWPKVALIQHPFLHFPY
jgi:hypothetical protein